MPNPVHVLLVAAHPDDRLTTETLELIAQELAGREDAQVAVWFLRAHAHGPGIEEPPHEPWWPGARIVDDLRTWWPARLLELAGLALPAARLRGARLRRWYREAAPDVVLLDDGLGARVIPPRGPQPVLAVRHNPVAPDLWSGEPAWTGTVDLTIGGEPPAAGEGDPVGDRRGAWMHGPYLIEVVDDPTANAARAPEHLRDLVEPIVVGWGGDGWVDGSDLFVRSLWHLEHRAGRVAHGLWLYDGDDDEHLDRLRAEAARCGLGDRLHLVADPGAGRRWFGDAVFLPFRALATVDELLETLAHGREVVTFAPAAFANPSIHTLEPLDLDGVAARLDRILELDGPSRFAAARGRLDAATWVDEFLHHTRQAR
ncbi:MAG: hypothetical protein JWM47_1567 [Acidimicrobiales bacterium]|nr:hypothetical protein [Acidimicrobiales bacterium]